MRRWSQRLGRMCLRSDSAHVVCLSLLKRGRSFHASPPLSSSVNRGVAASLLVTEMTRGLQPREAKS